MEDYLGLEKRTVNRIQMQSTKIDGRDRKVSGEVETFLGRVRIRRVCCIKAETLYNHIISLVSLSIHLLMSKVCEGRKKGDSVEGLEEIVRTITNANHMFRVQ